MNGEVSHDPEHRNGESQQPSRDVVAFHSLSGVDCLGGQGLRLPWLWSMGE